MPLTRPAPGMVPLDQLLTSDMDDTASKILSHDCMIIYEGAKDCYQSVGRLVCCENLTHIHMHAHMNVYMKQILAIMGRYISWNT